MPLLKKLLNFEHSFEEDAGKVAFPGVRKYHNYSLSMKLRLLGNLCGDESSGPAGNPGQQTFFPRQPPRHRNRFFAGDLFDAVQNAQIQVTGDESGSDTLNFVRT